MRTVKSQDANYQLAEGLTAVCIKRPQLHADQGIMQTSDKGIAHLTRIRLSDQGHEDTILLSLEANMWT